MVTTGSSVPRKAVVIANKLSFKGSGGSKGVKAKAKATASSSSSRSGSTGDSNVMKDEVQLTDAQKRHKQRQIDQEKRLSKSVINTPYRDRVEAFNSKLASMTEHNDIPRVSAAGNG